MMEEINRARAAPIITLEDPMEHCSLSDRPLIEQPKLCAEKGPTTP